MSLPATEPRQHMSTLTNGWRFTLPTTVRKAHGWGTGARLIARQRGVSLVFSADIPPLLGARADETGNLNEAGSATMRTRGNLAENIGDGEFQPVECYLGSGGKIVLPVPLRKRLGWVIGKRLVIVDEADVVSVTLCCDAKKCESCAGVSGVREIIPNIYLCSQCWRKYLQSMNVKLKWGRVKA